jgi:hypothetical protein
VESVAAGDEAAAVSLVRLNQTRAESDAPGEFEGRGLVREEGVGAAFEKESVAPLRAECASGPGGRFEQQHFQLSVPARLDETVRGGQATDARADDDDAPPAACSLLTHLSLREGVNPLRELRDLRDSAVSRGRHTLNLISLKFNAPS